LRKIEVLKVLTNASISKSSILYTLIWVDDKCPGARTGIEVCLLELRVAACRD